jgi:hypothetical protein
LRGAGGKGQRSARSPEQRCCIPRPAQHQQRTDRDDPGEWMSFLRPQRSDGARGSSAGKRAYPAAGAELRQLPGELGALRFASRE